MTRQVLQHELCRAAALALCAACVTGCDVSALNTAGTQRGLGEATISALDLNVALLPGVVRGASASDREVILRVSAGVGRLTIRTGDTASGDLLVTIRNVHPEASLSPRSVRQVLPSGSLENDCPAEDDGLLVNCLTAPADPRCQPPDTTRPADEPTTLNFPLTLSPCREATFSLELPEASGEDPVSFVVLGSMGDEGTLRQVVSLEQQAGQTHDFTVLLGDALEDSSAEAIARLDDTAREAPWPVVALPGREEIKDDEGLFFERYVGAFDYRWTLKNVQFVTFYSAEAKLAPRGLSNLESFLRAMESEEQRWRQSEGVELEPGQARVWPVIAFTHTPPFDPSGAREDAFRSRLEASRVMSLLAEYSVHSLFAGHLLDNEHVTSRPELWVTTAQDTRLDDSLAEYLRVTLTTAPRDGAATVGDRFMSVERIELPEQ